MEEENIELLKEEMADYIESTKGDRMVEKKERQDI